MLERDMPLPVGPDMAQALLNRMDGLTRTVEGLNRTVDVLTRTVNGRFDRLEERLIPMSIQIAKNANRNLNLDEEITPIPNIHGDLPPQDIFPRVQRMIATMTVRNVDHLLAFYEIVPQRRATANEKKGLLCRHLNLKRLGASFM
jgi:hypothetical protein